jgi:hypothetical protein
MRFGPGPRHAASKSDGRRHVRAGRHIRIARRSSIWKRWGRSRAFTTVGLVLALVGALTLSVKALGPQAPDPQASPTALLGAWVKGSSPAPSSQLAATQQLEAAIGRKLAIGHTYVPWGQGLGSLPVSHVAEGRIPMISFGGGANPRAVAAGSYDAYLKTLARSVGALGRPVLLRYAWGVDRPIRRTADRSTGYAYVAAWRHVHALFAAQGVAGSWVWAPDADVFAGARGGVGRYWPGDRYVDWIGAAGFNAGACNGGAGWSDFATIFKSFYAFGSARAKPLIVSETGTVEDPASPGRKQAWYLDAARTLAQSMPRIRAVVYFDEGGRCDWRPDTSAQSMEGFVRFARDPFFGGTAAPTVPPSSSTTTSTTVAATTTTTTRAPTTTAPPATIPPNVSRCVANGGVPIGTADNAQSIVNAHGAGTTYLVKAGLHDRNFSVRPKAGDTFCGEPGAVLDGGRSLQTAFSGQATNVTLDSITVQNYNTGRQRGAIQPDTHANGWTVRNVSALRNYWAGLMGADGMRILGGHYNDNDQLGISGNAATGIVLDGLDGDPATLDGPELARNHILHADCGYEAGGMKWDQGHVIIRNAVVRDNDCKGLWSDGNGKALVEHSLVEGNRDEGVYIEISQDTVIRNNRIYRNGLGNSHTWYWNGGVTVPGSYNVEVYGNRLSGNYNGITGVQQDRPDATPPAGLLNEFAVHDNLICAVRGEHPTGVVADNGANLSTRSITFSRNTIQSTPCE